MIQHKKNWLIVTFILLTLVFSTEARKRKSKKVAAKPESKIIIQTDSTGLPIRKERTPDEIFDALHSVLRAMTEDMDDFNFNKIHPHLKIVYALYNELRLLATDDSLLTNTNIQDTNSTLLKAINYNQSGNKYVAMQDTSSDSTVVITIDSTNSNALSALKITEINPVINEQIMDPSKLLKEKLIGNQPTSFSLSWDDTSFQKYLIKFEIVKDSVGFVWNVVFEKVDKLKNKTVKVHKYFDVGEFTISAQDLVWLSEAVKKTETEVLNYFYAKDKEEKEPQQ